MYNKSNLNRHKSNKDELHTKEVGRGGDSESVLEIDNDNEINTNSADNEVVDNMKSRSIKRKVNRHKNVACKVCLKTMRNDLLKWHMKQHADLMLTGEEEVSNGEYVCTACPKQFTSENLLDQHRLSTHDIQETLQDERDIYIDRASKAPLIEITRTVFKNMAKQNYECTICILAFSSEEALKKHEKA